MPPVLMNRTDNILGQRGEQTQVTTLLAQHIISCAGTEIGLGSNRDFCPSTFDISN